ncbi:YkvA family protein [Bacillus sp. Marseille-Q1617]|uniref:YkvA family protein n=1 Tax=Bacillus sp. Marseille-Q1617 TaxID=2736887 RepID=UPI001588A80E|nr:YkvA family protein [Bacillus sp. Marseille-Q1617]
MEKMKEWAKKLKQQILVLYLAYKDDRVPWYARLFTACVVAYALSPVDLIPDFIPVLGYLDDVILVPVGIVFALKMIPDEVIVECERKAEEMLKKDKPKNWLAGSVIILLWFIMMVWGILKVYGLFG